MNTDEQSRNPTASLQRQSPQRVCPWERTLPACSVYLTPGTQDACAPRGTQKNLFQPAKNLRASSTDPCLSVFICGFVHTFWLHNPSHVWTLPTASFSRRSQRGYRDRQRPIRGNFGSGIRWQASTAFVAFVQ